MRNKRLPSTLQVPRSRLKNQEDVQRTGRRHTPDVLVIYYGCQEPGPTIRECPNRVTVNTILSDVRDQQGLLDDCHYDSEDEEEGARQPDLRDQRSDRGNGVC